jgi:hypothetical protein
VPRPGRDSSVARESLEGMAPVSRRRRWPLILLGAVAVLVAALAITLAYIDEPLRRQVEARVNAQLKGYKVTIGELDLQPLGLAVELENVTMVQTKRPKPPMAYLPRWRTSVQWRALLSGALVADVEFDRPELYITQSQGEAEAADPTKMEDHGWQDAVESVYPLKINEVTIRNGSVTYYDESKLPPVTIRDLYVNASDIRNVRSRPGQFPSSFTAKCTIQDSGHLAVDGEADFLAEPTIAIRARYDLDDLALAFAQPIVRHYNVEMKGGVLAAKGSLQIADGRTLVDVADLELAKAHIDYVHKAETAAKEDQRLDTVKRAATTVERKPTTRVSIEKARMVDSEIGVVDQASKPNFRVFLGNARLELTGFSNERSERRGTAKLTGKFMDSGPSQLDASFAPAAKQADFALDLTMDDVDLRKMNDVLRAKGGFDVNRGTFSLYSEIKVRNGHVDGYVKPLFADMDVYDRNQDKNKNVFRQLYEGVVGGVSTILENHKNDEVATVADLSGPVENPNSSTLEIVLGLLRNAFIKAILPGLERERG